MGSVSADNFLIIRVHHCALASAGVLLAHVIRHLPVSDAPRNMICQADVQYARPARLVEISFTPHLRTALIQVRSVKMGAFLTKWLISRGVRHGGPISGISYASSKSTTIRCFSLLARRAQRLVMAMPVRTRSRLRAL